MEETCLETLKLASRTFLTLWVVFDDHVGLGGSRGLDLDLCRLSGGCGLHHREVGDDGFWCRGSSGLRFNDDLCSIDCDGRRRRLGDDFCFGDFFCWDFFCRDDFCWDYFCRKYFCWDYFCRKYFCWDYFCRDYFCWDYFCRDFFCRDFFCGHRWIDHRRTGDYSKVHFSSLCDLRYGFCYNPNVEVFGDLCGHWGREVTDGFTYTRSKPPLNRGRPVVSYR
ncbi:hypothetical protein EYF80_002107 [Liparis tanakae]|uniref:Uncharacterized protein n=1 Tax=Liparis tanakae TaxID=230148 RepID=A0A4Z2JC75_9TELE|nr:hypothetical protein EYF80_002107 [Liparis tanakae]